MLAVEERVSNAWARLKVRGMQSRPAGSLLKHPTLGVLFA